MLSSPHLALIAILGPAILSILKFRTTTSETLLSTSLLNSLVYLEAPYSLQATGQHC